MTHATSTRRGHGEDSIYWDATKNLYVGAIDLGFSPAGTRIRKKVRDQGVALARAAADDGVTTRKADDLVQTVQDARWQRPTPIRCRDIQGRGPGRRRGQHLARSRLPAQLLGCRAVRLGLRAVCPLPGKQKLGENAP